MDDAHTDGHADGGDEGKHTGHGQLLGQADGAAVWGCRGVGRSCCGGQLGDARAEGEAFEHLVEEDDGEEGEEEGVAGYDEGKPDYWDCQQGEYGQMPRPEFGV